MPPAAPLSPRRRHRALSPRDSRMDSTTLRPLSGSRIAQYFALTKPRVTQLAVFCAVIGMFLSTPGMVPWQKLVGGTIGIWLFAGAAFAINCLVEQRIDARMRRTAWRPSARGEITPAQILTFSAVLGGLGMWTLYTFTNALTMWLTFATFIGYAVIYTMLLKPATPQNIVIGGASGAMPPALGWAAVQGAVPGDAWILVLIIFVWTPPHFWALALYRRQDYESAKLPMLPVTHGVRFTALHILLYTLVLFAVTLMPFVSDMSGVLYLASAVVLGVLFLSYVWKMYRDYSDEIARKTFRYSIVYLSLLFVALLIDHYVRSWIGF
ncbi:Protoheme IX farnesyltransferase (EC 2.5.1.-) [Mycetohabitans rhizoxinica HKI 454]|uniref:Protoheme IX farnesyltransferase n=2 Tax=Mycetohabitans rhizoxinica TaxID=412963 RepID=E5ALY9_MYCRK|nr:Protoheme IX farnesyltransferase (EC 2.5.1.-) [Mycetohabitans rhizoxinica HKI 454]